MNTVITEFLTAVGFGTVCMAIITTIAGLVVLFEGYFIQKKMEKKSK